MVVKNARGAVFLKRVIRVLGIFLIFGLAAGAMWFVQSGKWKTTTLKEVYIEKPDTIDPKAYGKTAIAAVKELVMARMKA